MKNKKWIFFVAPPAAVLVVVLCGEIIKSLWNWLVPALFAGAHVITFWQALGLLLLCRLLFGSWGSGNGGKRRRRNREQWEAMTPEERERFRQGMRGACGGFNPPVEPSRPA